MTRAMAMGPGPAAGAGVGAAGCFGLPAGLPSFGAVATAPGGRGGGGASVAVAGGGPLASQDFRSVGELGGLPVHQGLDAGGDGRRRQLRGGRHGAAGGRGAGGRGAGR